MKCEIILVNTLIIVVVFLSLCEARGGRRGGSFGGIFGGWRKYKKPSSGGGSSRRIVSSSPVHTPITKAIHENKKTNIDKIPKNMNAKRFNNNYNTPQLPTGGSYYHNANALPGNAIYVAQAPPRGAEFGDFLTGYLTGRLLSMGFSSPHYHVNHVYRDTPSVMENTSQSNHSSSTVLIIEDQQLQSTEKPFSAPLVNFTTTTETPNSKELRSTTLQIPSSTTNEIPSSTTETPTPQYGIICMPMMIDDTNENGDTVQNERIVCYPAPAPPAPQKIIKPQPVEIAGDIIEH